MPDVYAAITDADPTTQEQLAQVLDLRAADARQRAMLDSYLARVELPRRAEVVEIGCGTGAVTRALASRPGVARAVGVDPCELFIARARAASRHLPDLRFVRGDGRALPLDDSSFDLVVVHTTLCHVPEPERLLAEAFRVLRPRGTLAVFDGDYATATVALGKDDPLERCMSAFLGAFVHDPWLVRRLPALVEAAGFDRGELESHGYVEASESGYMLTWIDRGARELVRTGQIDEAEARSLESRARQRNQDRSWFGHIAFASLIARKPETAHDLAAGIVVVRCRR